MEGPNLTQHEVIKFLTLRGGRCTNFELVSNFRGALNHPQHQVSSASYIAGMIFLCRVAQIVVFILYINIATRNSALWDKSGDTFGTEEAEARMRFKDIVNRVAIVGEYQNVKYIELKKEYRDNNLQLEPTSPQPSSLSSDSGGYSSPLTQSFQPYWRYRLSTSTKVPSIPVRNPDYEAYTKSPPDNSATPHMERSVSESTLSLTMHDIQPPPRTRGRSAGSTNRSVSENPSRETSNNPIPPYRRSSLVTEESLSRRSSINGYPPQFYPDFNDSSQIRQSGSFRNQRLANQQLPESLPGDQRRHSEVFAPERINRTQWPPTPRRDSNRPLSEYSSLPQSQNCVASHELPNTPHQEIQYSSSSNLDRWNSDKPAKLCNGIIERSSKRAGICSDDMLRELDEEASTNYMDTPVSKSVNLMHGIGTTNSNLYSPVSNDYSSLPEYSSSYSHPNKVLYQSPSNRNSLDLKSSEISISPRSKNEDTARYTKPVNRSLFSNAIEQTTNLKTNLSQESLEESKSESDTVSVCSSNSGKVSLDYSMLNGISGRTTRETENNSNKGEDAAPPVPPERRRKQSKQITDIPKEGDKPVELSSNVGNVKDRVQHFDGLEKKMNHHPKRGLSPVPDKENRSHKANLMEDDVSISVLDPKLKREWFVKAAQGDYYALVALLKREPKLAAIKDIATTALHWGAKHGDANIVKLIAGTYRVNPNIRTGYTAIHLATLYKHQMLVDLLVHTYGADASIRDYSGKRADQYPDNYVRSVAGLKMLERRPLKARTSSSEGGKDSGNVFMRIGSLNLRKSRKSAVFASVRGSTRNWGSATELRLNGYKSTRKKNSKNIQLEKKCDTDSKNESDSDSAYGFNTK